MTHRVTITERAGMRTALLSNRMAQVRNTSNILLSHETQLVSSKPNQVCNESLPHSDQVACSIHPLSPQVANKESPMFEVRKTFFGFAVINTTTGLAQSSHVSLKIAEQTARDLNWHQKVMERVKKSNKAAPALSLVK